MATDFSLGRTIDCKRLRVTLTYLFRHGRLPRLAEPRCFNELVQWRKLHDRDARMPLLADKVGVKRLVEERLGSEWVIPTLWHGTELPLVSPWKGPIVVKSRHGSNQCAFVLSDADDWHRVVRRSRRWMRSTYGYWLDEWLYRQIPRGILVEPFVGTDLTLPTDYKLFVFGGRVEFVQVHLGRGTGSHRWIVFDRRWRRVSAASGDADPARPASLDAMIVGAEELAREMSFVRVDLYEVGERPLFGELTFYPGSGLDPFQPRSLDRIMGEHWLRAEGAAAFSSWRDAAGGAGTAVAGHPSYSG